MTSPAAAAPTLHLSEQQSDAALRQRYELALTTAMHFAERYLPRDQALEIAHDVANMTLQLPRERVSNALIYIAVANRFRTFWRSTKRRAVLEGAYHDFLSGVASLWADPDVGLEVSELQRQIDECVAQMPPGMREVFLLIRRDELSYKETAARLRISVGTVHTQFSRAMALLRRHIAKYQSEGSASGSHQRNPKP